MNYHSRRLADAKACLLSCKTRELPSEPVSSSHLPPAFARNRPRDFKILSRCVNSREMAREKPMVQRLQTRELRVPIIFFFETARAGTPNVIETSSTIL